jgi:hypothetical protein
MAKSHPIEMALDYDSYNIFDFKDDKLMGLAFMKVSIRGVTSMHIDFDLREECARKLERDLLRQRNWIYYALSYRLLTENAKRFAIK